MITGASSDIIQAFAALVRSEIEDERVDLLRSALTFARIEDPQLDIEDYVRRVDELAQRVAEKIEDPDDPVEIIAALNDVLFQEEMFAATRWTITVHAILFFMMCSTAGWEFRLRWRWSIWKWRGAWAFNYLALACRDIFCSSIMTWTATLF